MTITLDDVKAGKLRDDAHMNYGPNGSGWLMQHSAIPRLSCIDRCDAGAARQEASSVHPPPPCSDADGTSFGMWLGKNRRKAGIPGAARCLP